MAAEERHDVQVFAPKPQQEGLQQAGRQNDARASGAGRWTSTHPSASIAANRFEYPWVLAIRVPMGTQSRQTRDEAFGSGGDLAAGGLRARGGDPAGRLRRLHRKGLSRRDDARRREPGARVQGNVLCALPEQGGAVRSADGLVDPAGHRCAGCHCRGRDARSLDRAASSCRAVARADAAAEEAGAVPDRGRGGRPAVRRSAAPTAPSPGITAWSAFARSWRGC